MQDAGGLAGRYRSWGWRLWEGVGRKAPGGIGWWMIGGKGSQYGSVMKETRIEKED